MAGRVYEIRSLYMGPHGNGGANSLSMMSIYEDLQRYLISQSERHLTMTLGRSSQTSKLEMHARFFHHTSFWLANLADRMRGFVAENVPEEW